MTYKHPVPLAALDDHIAVLGITGSGKTYTVKGLIELLLSMGRRVCAVDPTGAYWGLRASANGKSQGFPVTIFGGKHADIPLDNSHGKMLAEIIGTSNTPAIIDTLLMSGSQRTKFFADFAESLLSSNEGPLHLIMDEAHLFAPQQSTGDGNGNRMLHAANNLISLGRGRGLKIILISQRPAKLHKDSLTQVKTLIAMQMVAPQDRAAVKDWVGEWADPEKGKKLITELPSLSPGTGWVWAPRQNVLRKVKFPKIKTYDSSSATGGPNAQPPVMAKIDLPVLQERLQTVITEVEQSDPKALKAQVMRLKQQITELESRPSVNLQELEEARSAGYQAAMQVVADFIQSHINGSSAQPAQPFTLKKVETVPIPTVAVTQIGQANQVSRPVNIGKCEMAILNVLAQFLDGRTRMQIALLSGYSSKSSGFANALSRLRTSEMITGKERITITPAGQSIAPHDPLPRGQDLIDYWTSRVGKCEGLILDALCRVYPKSLSKEEIATKTNYSVTSSGFANALSKLRTLELIDGRGVMTASDAFFS